VPLSTFSAASVRRMMDLADVASGVVAPAMRAVFKPGEISAFGLRVTDELEGSVALSLTAHGARRTARRSTTSSSRGPFRA
jgi:hypothetical protein